MGAAMTTDHGYDPNDTRAVAVLRRLDTAEARQQATQIADLVTPRGARCSKRQGLHLAHLVRMLCDALDQARIELRQTRDYQELYRALVSDWNSGCAAINALGIDIYQPSGSDRWHWRYGPQMGSAPTIAVAWAQALRAAGAVPWEVNAPAADEAAQRAAREES
jgi:hypothetical protein